MSLRIALSFLVVLTIGPMLAQADQPPNVADSLAGRWVVTLDMHGTRLYVPLDIERKGETLSAKYGGEKIQGALHGTSIHFVWEDGSGWADAALANGVLSGNIVEYDKVNKERSDPHPFTAEKVPPRPSGTPQRHEFAPSVFYREFSPLNKPVLTVAPGDTIHTSTVDAGGTDEHGKDRVLGGNPQTGPFYIESAVPGDTLVVHVLRLKLNRDYAVSDDGIVGRGLEAGLAVKMKDTGKDVRWHLDLTKGLASLDKPGAHTAHYTIPVRPMLGCVATAPSPGRAAPNTGDSGGFGGNMDFNEIVDGATVYLPVAVPGALLYVGDGHAAQGDGELTGNALETSLDVELSVDVIPGHGTPAPRVESATHLMAMGFGGSLDDAFRESTTNMAQWLVEDYKLTPSEVAEVFGSAAEYKVSEVADRNAGVVLKLNKELLKNIH